MYNKFLSRESGGIKQKINKKVWIFFPYNEFGQENINLLPLQLSLHSCQLSS